jgi:hypothetical protein
MERDLFDWANVAMETIEIAALVAILWRLTHVQRDIRPLVRVVRRMDRKMTDTKSGALLAEVELERAGVRATGSGQ